MTVTRTQPPAGNEPSRRLKFHDHGKGHLPWVNARLEGAFSVIVELQSSRRFVCSSSGDVGRCRAHRSRAKMWVHPITLMYASTQRRRRGDARRGWAGQGTLSLRCFMTQRNFWHKEVTTNYPIYKISLGVRANKKIIQNFMLHKFQIHMIYHDQLNIIKYFPE